MKSIKKLFTAFTVGVAAMVCSAGCAVAAVADVDVIDDRGQIDWSTYTVIARGTAAGKESAPNPVIKQKQAAIAAKVVAERNLAELVNGVMVRSNVTVQDSVMSGDVVEARVQGVIKGAKEIDRQYDAYGNCTVTMALPMFGNNSLAQVVLPRTMTKKPFRALQPNVRPAPAVNKVTVNVTVTNGAQRNTSTTVVTVSDVKAAEPSNARPSHPTSRRAVDNGKTYAEPTYEEPTYDESAYDEPVYDEPVYDEPADEDFYSDAGEPVEQEDVTYEEPAVQPMAQKPTAPQPVAKRPATNKPAANAEYYDVSTAKPEGNFSSLVVDCRGLERELRPVMSAVILNTDGKDIYGVENLDYDLVTEKGMAAYTKDPTLAGVSRVGDNPLVVHAVHLDDQGGANPYISVEDANRVLLENQATGFLDKMNVVFLR